VCAKPKPLDMQVRESGTGEEEDVAERRVMAAVWGPGGPAQPATTLVMLDPQVTRTSRRLVSILRAHLFAVPQCCRSVCRLLVDVLQRMGRLRWTRQLATGSLLAIQR
jgi:hypothetical protein